MNGTLDLKINRIPSPTWNWLQMNETDVENVPVPGDGTIRQEIPAGVTVRMRSDSDLADIRTGMGADAEKLVSNASIHELVAAPHQGRVGSVRLDFDFGGSEAKADAVDITVGDGTDLTVVMNFRKDDNDSTTGAVRTRCRIGENAHLTLIQAQYIDRGSDFYNDIGTACADGGRFDLKQLILSGRHSCYGSYTALQGRKSAFTADIGYLLQGEEKLDMNYVALHTGQKTNCAINASGVLRGRADKLFRGTIDFRRGCAGSKGNEMEQVLLMDDTVINRTIPVILCDEEDVEGNHGASIGKLDWNLMFYLESRGLSLEQIYEMMARARIDAVISKIPDEAVREEAAGFLDRT